MLGWGQVEFSKPTSVKGMWGYSTSRKTKDLSTFTLFQYAAVF